MPLSALKVLELNEEYHLVEGLSERELENPEGIEIELRVGRVEKISGSSFLGVNERSSPSTELIADIEKDGNRKIIMKPGDYLLVRTIETINCPENPVFLNIILVIACFINHKKCNKKTAGYPNGKTDNIYNDI